MGQRIWVQGQVWGLVVGGVVTALVLTLYLSGRLDRLVLTFLDVNFRHFNLVEASDRIVMIDIDDSALERIDRWPWPRRRLAELISILNELGADVIVMDLVFPEPQAPRFDDKRFHRDYDVDSAREIHGTPSEQDWVFDDQELVAAIRAGGNVYLSMFYQTAPPDQAVGQLREAADQVFGADPLASLETFRQALPYQPGDRIESLYHHHRLRHLLLDDFGLKCQQLSQRLETPLSIIDEYLPKAKSSAARERVAAILDEWPQAPFEAVRARILPGVGSEVLSPDREDILRAYRSIRALHAADDRWPEVPPSMRGRLAQGAEVTAPLGKLAEAARQVGFVTRNNDFDGVLRRIPLAIDANGRLVKQLGFAVAGDLLGLDDRRMRLDGNTLALFDADGHCRARVPIDDEGHTLLNWHIRRDRPVWERSFDHLPVAAVLQVVSNRQAIEDNDTRWGIQVAKAVELMQESRYPEYTHLVNQRNTIRRKLRYLQSPGTAEDQALVAELPELGRSIEQVEKSALETLEYFAGLIEGESSTPPEDQQRSARISSLHQQLLGSGWRQALATANAELRTGNAELMEKLRPRVGGKVCFVGFTATALADLVNTPVYDTVPGVMVHANVVNSLLQGSFPKVASRGMNALLLLLAGTLVTLVTAQRGPWVALVCVLLTIALLMAVSFAFFAGGAYYLASAVAVLTVFVSWAFVTLYRQLTEERAKRQLAKTVAQYNSPAIVAQIVEQHGFPDLTPRSFEVTCFFSDLRSFTALSERLGAERTRAVLNPYMVVMSKVLNDHKAFINKFMGDGLFAFFNPPILSVPNHPAVACQAALDSMAALERLKSDLTGGLGPDVAALQMRVGINSGTVFVGEYGVDKKDYTCIGDAVNLAARLEPANKVFGTGIMVSQETRRGVGDGFEFRPLGSLQVVGKQEAVPVYELLGRYGEVDDARRRYAALFAEAVRLFQDRRWAKAAEALNACRQERPDDLAVHLYLDHVDRYRASPPPDDWNRGIELTAK